MLCGFAECHLVLGKWKIHYGWSITGSTVLIKVWAQPWHWKNSFLSWKWYIWKSVWPALLFQNSVMFKEWFFHPNSQTKHHLMIYVYFTYFTFILNLDLTLIQLCKLSFRYLGVIYSFLLCLSFLTSFLGEDRRSRKEQPKPRADLQFAGTEIKL